MAMVLFLCLFTLFPSLVFLTKMSFFFSSSTESSSSQDKMPTTTRSKHNPKDTFESIGDSPQRRKRDHGTKNPSKAAKKAKQASGRPKDDSAYSYAASVTPNVATVTPKDGSTGNLFPPPIVNQKPTKKAKKVQDPWKNHVAETIKSKGWKVLQFIDNNIVGIHFAKKVIGAMDMDGYTGNSPEAEAERDAWASQYDSLVISCHNAHRNSVCNKIKAKVEDRYTQSKAGGKKGSLPRKDDIIRMLKRDFDPNSKTDYDLMKWYWTGLIPAATGNTTDWGRETHLYCCLFDGAPPNDPTKLYVTPSIEAFAVWCYVGNRSRYLKQCQVKDDHPKIKQIMIHKGDHPEDKVRYLGCFGDVLLTFDLFWHHLFPLSPSFVFCRLFLEATKTIPSFPTGVMCILWGPASITPSPIPRPAKALSLDKRMRAKRPTSSTKHGARRLVKTLVSRPKRKLF